MWVINYDSTKANFVIQRILTIINIVLTSYEGFKLMRKLYTVNQKM